MRKLTEAQFTELLQNEHFTITQGEFVETNREELFDSWDESTGIHVAGYIEQEAEANTEGFKVTHTSRYSFVDGDSDSFEVVSDESHYAYELSGAELIRNDGGMADEAYIDDFLQKFCVDSCFFPSIEPAI